MVVRVVATMWRVASKVVSAIASASPVAACGEDLSADKTTIDPLIAKPIRPIAPTIALKPLV